MPDVEKDMEFEQWVENYFNGPMRDQRQPDEIVHSQVDTLRIELYNVGYDFVEEPPSEIVRAASLQAGLKNYLAVKYPDPYSESGQNVLDEAEQYLLRQSFDAEFLNAL